jgi:hypothetical protein
MIKCPVCDQPVKDSDLECACGESLAPWRTLALHGQALRHRGLALAQEGDAVGACLFFVEAALTNPHDGASLIDAARALAHAGRAADALRWLAIAESRPATRAAAGAVARAVRELAGQASAAGAAAAREGARDAATTDQPAAPANGLRRLLALGPVERSPGLLDRLWGGHGLDSVWATVLSMEEKWPGDWRALVPWLEGAIRESQGHPVFCYMAGLGHWQHGDRKSAKAILERCLKGQPPVANPAAYYLCLHLGEPAAARKAVAFLREAYDPASLDHCLGLLEGRLRGWNETALLAPLAAARGAAAEG